MPLAVRRILLAACVLCVCGCAAPAGVKPDPRDPWEGMNRATYKFNDGFDRNIFKPVAKGYRKVLPQFARTGIHNFFTNLGYPIVMLNDLLQAQFKAFASDTGRLVLNTTVGIGGLFDPASAAGLDRNDRDFGQTLGVWGVKPGPYLMLPFMGPSDVRDTVGVVGDELTDPRNYIFNYWVSWGLFVVSATDQRNLLLDTADKALEGAFDKYSFLRNAYLQHRDFKVHGGQSTNEEDQERLLLEQAGEDDSGDATPAPGKNPLPPASQSPVPVLH
jgi:phospholipid-binding lipoprotein MlaA